MYDRRESFHIFFFRLLARAGAHVSMARQYFDEAFFVILVDESND